MILGMDIGYSNLKLVYGDVPTSLTSITLPVGVKRDDTSQGLSMNDDRVMRVLVDDDFYIAGISPSDVSLDYQRTLHANYSSSKAYKALFHASLLSASREHIDLLVTGLPVNQYIQPEVRKELQHQLEGTHQVTKKKSVTVDKVIVMPQPLGGYISEMAHTPTLFDYRLMVLDPGFFSVDWTIVRNGNVVPGALGTSIKAVSALFEQASKIIFRDYGGKVSIEDIEKAVITNEGKLFLFGDEVDLEPIIDAASKIIGESLKTEIQSSLRSSKFEIDAVLIIGGGAKIYQNMAREMFPKSKIILSDNPVQANANGFWNLGLNSL